LKHSSNYFYIVKKYITNSDDTAVSNGFIYSGKLISNDVLNTMTKFFDEVSIKNKTYIANDILIDSNYLKNTKIKIEENIKENLLINNIQLYDYKNKYILTIRTETKRELIERGKTTILYYNIAISIFLLLIFFLIFKNQRILERYSNTLESKVNEKTKKLLESNKKLKIISEEDYLTKINNRRSFFHLGNKALENAISNNSELIILMIDLDNFKKINDTYGHDIGDEVLIHTCEIISDILAGNHIFARIGGEEFAIIFNKINYDEAYKLTEKILHTIENSFVENKGNKIKYTVSIGFAQSKDEKSIDLILKNADELLYSAKQRGKNCIIRKRLT
jgi:diguanylate cyclase (GGDEF)-like protein